MRTSLALSMIGVTISQLFRLGNAPTESAKLGYFELGKPLGAICQAAALAVTAIACHRYLRQQLSMARGKVWASGWEPKAIIGGLFLVSVDSTRKRRRGFVYFVADA